MKMLLAHGVLNGDCMTVTGKTIAENLADVPEVPRADQEVIRPWERAMYAQGHLSILRGNLAPGGCVAKTSGVKHRRIEGPAKVFDCEEEACTPSSPATCRLANSGHSLRRAGRWPRHARDAGSHLRHYRGRPRR